MFVKNGLVLHHLATLFDNTNAVSKPKKGDQIMHVFCQTFTKSCQFHCQMTNNVLQMMLPKFC